MTFDTIIIPPCENPNSAANQPTCGGNNGGDDGGIDNSNCSDPVYAAANPGICLSAPRLIVKPDYAIREVGKTIEYRAFLWANGVETEVTDSVTWNTSNLFVAVIGSDGHATALSVGIVTVSATYGFLNGYAQLEVIAEGACATAGNTYVLVIDNSESSGAPFSGMYPSRLEFAKEQARRFLDNVDFGKDHAAVIAFNGSPMVMAEESEDVDVLKTAVSSIPSTDNTTNIKAALVEAAEMEVSGRRVIILFSDGENKEGDNPVDYAITLRSAATFIIGVGLRAHDAGFRTMNRIANGGFFLNAIPSNQANIQGYLSGLQSYLCSGNCVPEGDGFFGVGRLNFSSFTNWDVTGRVDLIGRNDGGPELFDLLAGNGLYVDLCGSEGFGSMRTKDGLITWENVEYTLSLRLAGNQREDRTPDVVEVKVYDGSDNLIHSQEITFTDHKQDFTLYTMTFTPSGGSVGPGGYVIVAQKSIAAGGWIAAGNLFDSFLLKKTSGDIILEDNFDDENSTFVPPGCGEGEAFPAYTGYCYGYGCLDEPIPAQVPDPEPLDDLEA